MRARSVFFITLCCLSLVTTLAAPARADEPASSVATALFEDAMALMKEGRFAEACPKLRESHRVDPAGGTILNLAICLEKEGKTASAYVAYDEALGQAVKDANRERETSARERLTYLKPLLSNVVIHVAPNAARIGGLDVQLDGVRVRPEGWGIRVPIDPGTHAVTASAPSHADFKTGVTVSESGKVYEVAVPDLVRTAADPTPPPTTKEQPATDGSRRSTLGYVLLIGGGVFVLGGATSGILSLSAHAESNDECPSGPSSCTSAGVRAEDAAERFAWGANIGIGLGLIAAGVGTYLLLTTPAAPTTKVAR